MQDQRLGERDVEVQLPLEVEGSRDPALLVGRHRRLVDRTSVDGRAHRLLRRRDPPAVLGGQPRAALEPVAGSRGPLRRWWSGRRTPPWRRRRLSARRVPQRSPGADRAASNRDRSHRAAPFDHVRSPCTSTPSSNLSGRSLPMVAGLCLWPSRNERTHRRSSALAQFGARCAPLPCLGPDATVPRPRPGHRSGLQVAQQARSARMPALAGWRSLLIARASIWRIRSRVRSKWRPTSSRVRGSWPSRP